MKTQTHWETKKTPRTITYRGEEWKVLYRLWPDTSFEAWKIENPAGTLRTVVDRKDFIDD